MRLDDPSIPTSMKLTSLKLLLEQMLDVVLAIEKEVIE